MVQTEKKVLGVIGGLGPIATTHFMELVIRMTEASQDQEHVDMIVYNFPSIPDRTGYILGSNLKSPLPGLLWVGRSLARQGVDCIAIPCITAHFFYDELSEEIRVPILNAVAETVNHLKDQGVKKAGIMATDGTIVSGLFSHAMLKAGITPVIPTRARQADVMHLIYNNVKAGKPVEMERFWAVGEELRQRGAETVVLGCTELSAIKRDHRLGPGYLDSMEVLARKAILQGGKTVRKEYDCLISR